MLVVGTSVVDLFLSLDSDHYEVGENKVRFNLGDKIPAEIKTLTLGGNGANVGVGLTRLEIPTTFYTYLGRDILSREIEEKIAAEGIELISEKTEEGNSALHIILDFNNDRIILSHYHQSEHGFSTEKVKNIDYIFLTSISDYWEKAYEKILNFATTNNIPLAFSPGTRQIEDKNDLVTDLVKSSKIYFSNKEEATKIINHQSSTLPGGRQVINPKDLLLEIKKVGPEVVSITDGPRGAYAVDKDNNCFFIKPAPSEGTEKTGAGDAYTSGFFASYILSKDIVECMKWGTLNAGSVMSKTGAQNKLLTKREMEKLLLEYADFKAEKI